jgi:hypothetical protein
MQAGPAREYGYTGPVNGIMGKNSWQGIQRYLKARWGYTGSISGSPGGRTFTAIQRAANSSGLYEKPVALDGTLELKDWQGWAYRVRINYFTD